MWPCLILALLPTCDLASHSKLKIDIRTTHCSNTITVHRSLAFTSISQNPWTSILTLGHSPKFTRVMLPVNQFTRLLTSAHHMWNRKSDTAGTSLLRCVALLCYSLSQRKLCARKKLEQGYHFQLQLAVVIGNELSTDTLVHYIPNLKKNSPASSLLCSNVKFV